MLIFLFFKILIFLNINKICSINLQATYFIKYTYVIHMQGFSPMGQIESLLSLSVTQRIWCSMHTSNSIPVCHPNKGYYFAYGNMGVTNNNYFH